MHALHIHTPRLHIRNLHPDDLEAFHRYRSNPDVTRYQGFEVMSRDQARAFIEKQQDKLFGKPGEWVQYGIEFLGTEQLVGDCAIRLREPDPRIAEIGITISHLEQGRGFAKEAMRGIMKFLFEDQQVHRIEETVDAQNAPSMALMESLGFRKEGHFVENVFFKGAWSSEVRYAMLRREYIGMQPTEKA